MVTKVIHIEDKLEKYRWVKAEVLLVVSLLDFEKKVDNLANGLRIARDTASKYIIVPTCCIFLERVCMADVSNSRPFCYFYETLFRKFGVRLPLTTFEMNLLNVV
jgi:hypothetical protein